VSQYVLDRIKGAFPDAVLESGSYRGDEWVRVQREQIVDICRFLRDDSDIDMRLPVDLTVVDRLHMGLTPRFDVVYHLASLTRRHRIRIKVGVPADEAEVSSVVEVFPGFNWFEREAYDMFGVVFKGHPDLRRILLYEEFEGHPLRKDFAHDRAQPRITPTVPIPEPPRERRVVPPWERSAAGNGAEVE